MARHILWHGHANFQIAAGGVNLIFDPFFTGNPKAAATPKTIQKPDIVLLTHTHGDHQGDAVDICKNFKSLLACAVGAGDEMAEAGVPKEQILNGHGFNIGGTVEAKGVRITMTQAFHTIAGVAPVGYVAAFPDGFTVYHAGDTGIFSSMELLGELYAIDLALLPSGSVYTMDMRQAALAARLLRAKNVIPMHWGTFPALAQNMDGFAAELAKTSPGCKAIIMNPGESVTL